MKGKPAVLAALETLLADELSARDQYLAHAHLLGRWGYRRLAERIAHEAEDEGRHADALIQRMLLLDARPTMARSPLELGRSVPEVLERDLAVELRVRDNLNRAMACCEAEHDSGSYLVLVPLLHDTEVDHALWLEKQLHAIREVGLALYLQQQT